MALCTACSTGSYQEAQRVNLNQKLRPVLRAEFFRFVQKYGLPAKKMKNFLKKSVTFFISADYICRIIDNKKSLFSHVLSILLHRRLHRTQFCIIIYPEKAGVRQKYIAACIAYSRLENDNHLSTPIWVQRQRLPHLCRCAASRSGR